MKKIVFLLNFLGVMTLSSCSSFLERTPENSIASNNFFVNESALITYTNGLINNYIPDWKTLGYGDGFSDIVATEHSVDYLYTPQWSPAQQDGWSSDDWHAIYDVNYFLAHFREVPDLDEDKYNHFEATARFWRAWKYWDFVKKFGAVPWYDEPIDPEDEEALYKTRDNREYVMEKVLDDLNYACENLYASGEWINCACISKYVALALKARVCLFEGTYRKYHSVDPSTGISWQDPSGSDTFLHACVDACENLINAGMYSLVDDGSDVGRRTQYRSLFTQESINYTEIIYANEFSTSMAVTHELTWKYTSPTWGERWGLDQDFVQTYLHLDGSRHSEVIAKKQSDGDEVTLTTESFADEVADRDYRLMQHIITPGYKKVVNGADSLFSQNINVSFTGYQPIKWNIDDSSYESGSNSYNSLSIFRYAEILLNYAEAKCELGEMDDNIWNQTIRPLRERAGVDGRRRSDIDQTLAEYYGGLTDADLVEVRRERAIEMLLENLRYDDLMRWHLGDLLNKQWYGIYIANMNEAYDLDGNGSLDVVVVDSSDAVASYTGVTMVIDLSNSSFKLENGDNGRLIWTACPRYFEDKRYLHPIPQTALAINANLGQNYYWQ